ncbi:hemagglutinin repeat-containing protein [Collimonas pratensis]|uniref:Hemagluttinin repeat family protein n=1 Tax=Collimonas pratensis TaxID=279113 RepID=A0ABM5ZB83_9BURK|nr:hemagglutinin repeat-containing protein [Collimonas pratensis]AMP16359.1 hemagluttinin repeat family protein [Collimonas pratensis]
MNKNNFRVIFNKNRGMLMAVAENVASQGKGTASGSASSASGTPLMRLVHLGVAIAALFGGVTFVQAQIVADPNAGNRRPTVSTTATGIPLVNIVAPNSSGLSHNQYNQFSVGAGGAILNNAPTSVQTQQAGWVPGNANLTPGNSARIILNEVTGTGRSQLNGYVEVAGQRAEVIIANPNGVSVNGGGFINTSRAVLTTGTPVLNGDGSLSGFRVTGGDIQIGANGLNGNNLDQLDLISRSVAVNGQLWANQLNVITGANQVNYADLGVQVIAGDNNKPTVGIDVALLGGMYANKIKLVGTENGVGVMALGNVASQAGDLNIDSQGQITLAGRTTATGSVRIAGNDGITNSGTLYSQQGTQLYSAGQIANSGTIAAQSDLLLFSGSINSTGVLGAGIDANSHATQPGSLTLIAAGAISATGQNTATTNFGANAGTGISLAHGQTSAGGNIGLATRAGNIDLTGGTLQAAGSGTMNDTGALINDQGNINVSQLTVNSGSVSNAGGAITQSGIGATSITTTGALSNNAGSITTNGQSLSIASGSLDNTGGQINHAGSGAATIQSGALTNAQGTIASNGQVNLTAASLNNQGGRVTALGSENLHVAGDVSNSQGTLQSGGALSLAGANIDNTSGNVKSLNGDGLTLTASGQLINAASGVVGGNGNVAVSVGAIVNSSSITAAQNLSVTAVQALNNASGTLAASGAVNSTAGTTLTNNAGTISGAQVNLGAHDILNQSGVISQSGAAAMTISAAGVIDNTHGSLTTNAQNLTVNAGSLNNTSGQISHAGSGIATIQTGALSNAQGVIASNGQVAVSAASLNNQGGRITAQGSEKVNVAGDVSNSQGTLQSSAALTLTGANIDNTGGSLKSLNADGLTLTASGQLVNAAAGVIGGNGNVAVSAGAVVNSSSITAAQNLSVTAAQALDNSSGTLAASGAVNSSAGATLTNNAGTISGAQVSLGAHDIVNQSGTISQSGTAAMTIAATGFIDNTHGALSTNAQNLTINSGSLNNTSGKITHAGSGTATIHSGAVTNAQGIIASNGQVAMTAASLNNQTGQITAAGTETINASGAVSNEQGTLLSGGALALTAGSIDNTAGAIKSLDTDGLTLTASGQLTNAAAGIIGGNGNVAVSAGSLTNSSTISAAQNLTVAAAQALDNSSGTLAAGGVLTGTAGTTLTDNAGTIAANQVTLHAHDIVNQAGLISQTGAAAMTLQATGLLNNAQGKIQSNASDLTLTSGALNNDNGVISQAAAGILNISTGALSNQQGSVVTNGAADIVAGATTNSGSITAQQTLNLAATSLNNNSGTLASNAALTINAGSQLSNSGGKIQSGSTAAPSSATITTTTLDNSGGVLGAGTIDLEAGTLKNAAGQIIQNNGNGTATINVLQLLDNSNGMIGVLARNLTLAPATLKNDGGSVAHMGTGALIVQTGALSNNGGVLGTNGAGTITASSIVNQGGKLTAVGNESVTSAAALDNSVGGYIGGAAVVVNATAGQVNNQGGTIEGATAGATVNAQSINNAAGKIQNLGTGAIAVNVAQALDNDAGSISGKGNVTAAAGSISNVAGAIGALGNLTVSSASALDNLNGAMEGMGNVSTTAQGALSNVGGKIESLGSGSQLQVSGGTLDNTNGKIIDVGIGLTTVAATTSITNADPSAVTGSGLIGGAGDVTIATPVLSNVQGGHIVAGGALNLNTSTSVDNTAGQLLATGALTMNQPGATLINVGGGISGGSVTLTTASIDNTSGSIANPAGSGGGVAITTGTLTNTNGSVGSDVDLTLSANALVGDGKIVAGRDGNVSLQGNYTYDAGNQITANRNLTLSTTGTLVNTGTLAAAGNLTVNAANLYNVAGADIASGNPGDLTSGVTTVNIGTGAILNAGRIEGNSVNTTSNLLGNTGTVIGNNVTVNATTLTNDGAAAIIAGVNQVNLWVTATINNQNGATLYSLGDLNMAANGAKDANGYLFNQTGTINNLSSTIEADGALNVAANQINNVRQNVQTNTVTTSDTTTTMTTPSWWSSLRPSPSFGGGDPLRNANTRIRDAYYVDPSQVISSTPMVTPDGFLIYKVVVKLSANDSAFEYLQSDLTYPLPNGGGQIKYGGQSRVTPTAGTQTLYVTAVANNQTNPDQIANGDAWSQFSNNVILNTVSSITYSNQYGGCTTNCIRLQTYKGYTDPNGVIGGDTMRTQADNPGGYPVEVQRTAHQVVTETQLLSTSGAPAKLTSGGDMHMAIGTQLNNNNGQIAAGGNLTIDGVASADGSNNTKILNTATQLTRTYTSDNQSGFGSANMAGSTPVQWTSWSNTPITQNIGVVGGTITSNQAVSITGGQISNTSVGASTRPVGQSAASLGLGDGIAPFALATDNTISGVPSGNQTGVGGAIAVGGSGNTSVPGASTGGLSAVGGSGNQLVGGSTGALPAATSTTGTTTPGAARVVDGARAGAVNTVLPTNGLYQIEPKANQPYLIQTDPRFTQYGNFISSDYMLNLLGINPAVTQKRLGDGFYEEKLVTDQVTNLTGMRYLHGYASAEDEYKSLMTNGAQYAKQFSIVPGMALSDAQMAALTTDIVWLVSQTVTLPDGSHQTVLVPQVYLAKNMDLSPTGALIAGNSVSIKGTDITNNGGTYSATQQLTLAADHDISNIGGTLSGGNIGLYAGNNILSQSTTNTAINNFGNNSSAITAIGAIGTIAATQNLIMSAGQNLTLQGAQVNAGGNTKLRAGNAINVETVTTGTQYVTPTGNTSTMAQATHVVGSNIATGGNLTLQSGGDINVQASNLSSGQNMLVAAAGNVNITNGIDTNTYHSAGSSKDGSQTLDRHTETNIGSNLTAGANATVLAGAKQDINGNLTLDTTSADPAAHTKTLVVQGSTVSAGNNADGKGEALLGASGNVSIVEAHRQNSATTDDTSQSKGWFSSSSSHTNTSFNADMSTGSTVTGNGIKITSGGDLGVQGSAIAGTGDVSLNARNNVVVDAAQNTVVTHSDHEEKKSGIFGTGGIGFMIGSKSSKDTADGNLVTQSDARSTVGSAAGNLTITAGKDVLVSGSDLIAGQAAGDTTGKTGNIGILAQNITINTGVDTEHDSATHEAKQSGVSTAVVGTPLDTVRNLQAIGNDGGSKGQKTKAGLDEIGFSSLTTPQVALTVGSSSSNSQTSVDSTTNTGSSLQAAGNISLKATGDGTKDANGKANNGNIIVAGSTVSAGGDVQFDAQRDITIQTATDRYAETSQTSSKSSSVSLAAPSPGDILRNLSGGENSGGVGLSPYNASNSHDNSSTQSTGQLASSISGNTVSLTSHTGDITVAGSSISAKNDINLNAQLGQITVEAGQNDQTHHDDQSTHVIGGLGSSANGTASTVGVSNTSSTTDSAQQLQNPIRSQIVSQNGSVTLNAKQDITVKGSDLSAANNLTLIGQNLNLDPGQDSSQSQQAQHSSQYGVTVALGGVAGQVNQTVNQGLAAQAGGDNRVAALNAAKAGLIAANAVNGITTPGGPTPALVKVTVSIGGGSSDSKSDSQATTNQGSTLSAGKDVTLIATGNGNKDAGGFATDGDINAHGTQISGQNVTLAAARDINLESAKDTTLNHSTNDSSNASIGVGAAIGGTQNGFTLELAAAQANGKSNGQSVTNQNTVITGTQTTTLASGRDANLLGAQVRGDTVNATVGRDLNIHSQQDTSTYQSVQNSSGVNASICVPPFCYGTTVQANGSMDSQNINSTYASVNQQSGIVAGNGGYNLNVKGNTDLVGGLIASNADKSKNSLTTGTLTVSDIQNTAQYSADGSHIGASVDSGSGPLGNVLNNAVDNTAGNSQNPIKGNAAGTTKSAISDGSIVITDQAGQQAKTGKTADELIASISHDTTSANGSINQIFDLKTVQHQQQVDQLTSQIAQQAAPLLYKQVGDFLDGDSTPTKVLVHGLVGGLMAKAIGGNFGTGAAGSAAAILAVEVFGQQLSSISDMTPDEKNALIQLVGLTVGKAVAQLAGGTSADGNAAAVTAKLATQFNYLSHTEAALFKKKLDSCDSRSGGCPEDERNALIAQYRALSDQNDAALNLCTLHADAACLKQISANIATPSEMPVSLVGAEATAFRGDETRAQGQADAALINLAAIQKGRAQVCGTMSTADCDAKILQAHGDASLRAMGIVLATIGGGVASSAEALNIVSGGLQVLIKTGQVVGTELASLYRLGPVAYCALNANTCIDAVDVTAQTATGTAAPSPSPHLPNVSKGPVVVADSNQSIESLFGQTLNGPLLSHTPGIQNGVLGEAAGLQTLQQETGLTFKPFQNNSGNGADGASIDASTHTIWVAEVKSSQNGVDAAASAQGDPTTRLTKWLALSTSERKAWAAQPASNAALADDLQQAIDAGYQIKGVQVQVGVPAPGKTGTTQVSIKPWPPK